MRVRKNDTGHTSTDSQTACGQDHGNRWRCRPCRAFANPPLPSSCPRTAASKPSKGALHRRRADRNRESPEDGNMPFAGTRCPKSAGRSHRMGTSAARRRTRPGCNNDDRKDAAMTTYRKVSATDRHQPQRRVLENPRGHWPGLHFGGQELRLPARAQEGHPLRSQVGRFRDVRENSGRLGETAGGRRRPGHGGALGHGHIVFHRGQDTGPRDRRERHRSPSGPGSDVHARLELDAKRVGR